MINVIYKIEIMHEGVFKLRGMLPSVPRQGEVIIINNTFFTVANIYYRNDRGQIYIDFLAMGVSKEMIEELGFKRI